jgi:hypothetical protein
MSEKLSRGARTSDELMARPEDLVSQEQAQTLESGTPETIPATPSPEESLAALDEKMESNDSRVNDLDKSIVTTKTRLNEVRGELGIPPSDENPPSVVTSMEKSTSLKNESDVLKSQRESLTRKEPGPDKESSETPPENQAPTEPTQNWRGNWQNGERPEGYKAADERYAGLKSKGFSATENLGQDFVTKYNELMTKARSGTELSGEELRQLQENNSRFHTAMDEFEKRNPNQPKNVEKSVSELQDDPDIIETQKKISDRIRDEVTQIQAGTWGKLATEGDYEERTRRRVNIDAWSDFVKNNPDKADRYRDRVGGIREALETKATRQRQLQEQETMRQANQRRLDEKIATWKRDNPQASESVEAFRKRLDDKIEALRVRALSPKESPGERSVDETTPKSREEPLENNPNGVATLEDLAKRSESGQKFPADESLQARASNLERPTEQKSPDETGISPEKFDIANSRVEEDEASLASAINKISNGYEHRDQNFDLSKLDHKDYIPGSILGAIPLEKGEDLGRHIVPTRLIGGSMSPAFETWRDEYADRPGRIVETAKNIKKGDSEELQRIFSIFNKERGIKLKRLAGPSGDFFVALDGTHRIASAKLAEIPDILANVEDQKLPEVLETNDGTAVAHWEDLLKLGLIEGKIEDDTGNPEKRILRLRQAKIPWALSRWPDFVKINNYYQSIYPHAFESSSIPKEVLFDESGIAKNYWLNGRWQEYLERSKRQA